MKRHSIKETKKGYITMANEVKNNELIDITDVERTENYIQFQISQAESMLEEHHRVGSRPFIFHHIVTWKKNLQSELDALRK